MEEPPTPADWESEEEESVEQVSKLFDLPFVVRVCDLIIMLDIKWMVGYLQKSGATQLR